GTEPFVSGHWPTSRPRLPGRPFVWRRNTFLRAWLALSGSVATPATCLTRNCSWLSLKTPPTLQICTSFEPRCLCNAFREDRSSPSPVILNRGCASRGTPRRICWT
ncbi:unnamed protein product, partial [Ectocarpus fasciculatus]